MSQVLSVRASVSMDYWIWVTGAVITRSTVVGRPGGLCRLVVYFSGALHPREQLLVMMCQLAGVQQILFHFQENGQDQSVSWPVQLGHIDTNLSVVAV